MNETNRKEIVTVDFFNDIGVLLVDDDVDNLRMLKIHFKMAGFKTCCAMSGEEALLFLRAKLFTFMITDYCMPGMNGLMLSKEAKKIAPELNIIMVTGCHSAQIVSDAERAGISAVLRKPLNIDVLIDKVRTIKHGGGLSWDRLQV